MNHGFGRVILESMYQPLHRSGNDISGGVTQQYLTTGTFPNEQDRPVVNSLGSPINSMLVDDGGSYLSGIDDIGSFAEIETLFDGDILSYCGA